MWYFSLVCQLAVEENLEDDADLKRLFSVHFLGKAHA